MKNILSYLLGVLVTSLWWMAFTIRLELIALAIVGTVISIFLCIGWFINNWETLK